MPPQLIYSPTPPTTVLMTSPRALSTTRSASAPAVSTPLFLICNAHAGLRLASLPACKLHHVADCSVQRENASSQNVRTGSSALTVQHLDVETSQAIPAIGHTRGAQCISDKHRAFRTFGPKKQLDYGRIDVNAISNDVRTKTVISE